MASQDKHLCACVQIGCMWKIKLATLESILLAARNTYPNEFMSLLGGSRQAKNIDELVVVPAVFGETFTLVQTHLIPFDQRIVGSVHSHPSGRASPSAEDLNAFSAFGDIHLIVGEPFALDSVRAYTVAGKAVRLQVV